MESKVCSKCGIDKDVEEFQFWSKAKNIRRPECKACSSNSGKAQRREKSAKMSHIEKPPKLVYTDSKPCSKCDLVQPMEQFWFMDKKNGIRRPDCITCCRKYKAENAEHIKEQKRRHRAKPEVKAAEAAKREARNKAKPPKPPKMTPDEIKDRNNRSQSAKRRSDPGYAIMRDVISSVAHVLSGDEAFNGLTALFFKMVGYTDKQLLQHIEGQFEEWMTWSNRGPY